MSQDNEPSAFTRLLSKLARVPKAEIDAQERRDERNKARRKTSRSAKPGHIVPTEGPAKR